MSTALEQFKQKQTVMQRVQGHRNTVRRVVDASEAGAGAVLAGAMDTKLPAMMGAKPSLLVGIAALVGGAALSQRDAMAFGFGMVLPHLYGVGQGLAS